MGYLLCIQNNRNNDIFKIFDLMIASAGSADVLNAMDDAEFYAMLGPATQTTLERTIPKNKWKHGVKLNFERIYEAYDVVEEVPAIEPAPEDGISQSPPAFGEVSGMTDIAAATIALGAQTKSAVPNNRNIEAVPVKKQGLTPTPPPKRQGLLARAERIRARIIDEAAENIRMAASERTNAVKFEKLRQKLSADRPKNHRARLFAGALHRQH
jgi:hypothetical protein